MIKPLKALPAENGRKIENFQRILRLKTLNRERPKRRNYLHNMHLNKIEQNISQKENLFQEEKKTKKQIKTTRDELTRVNQTIRDQARMTVFSDSGLLDGMKLSAPQSYLCLWKVREKGRSVSQCSNHTKLQHAKSIQLSYLKAKEQLIGPNHFSIQPKSAQILKISADKIQPLAERTYRNEIEFCRNSKKSKTGLGSKEISRARYHDIPMAEFLFEKERKAGWVSSSLERKVESMRQRQKEGLTKMSRVKERAQKQLYVND